MILDEGLRPLGRSWCLFELLQTLLLEQERESFEGMSFCTNSGIVNLGEANSEVSLNMGERVATLRLEDADASSKADLGNAAPDLFCLAGLRRVHVISRHNDDKYYMLGNAASYLFCLSGAPSTAFGR